MGKDGKPVIGKVHDLIRDDPKRGFRTPANFSYV